MEFEHFTLVATQVTSGRVYYYDPDKGTVKVIVTIFGRPTPVELEYWEVEAV